MLAVIESGTIVGIDALPVQVEVNTGETGEWRLVLVGLPDATVREAQDRVTSALLNTGYQMPRTRTTINLAPSYLRKEGPLFDLPIALGILAATQQFHPKALEDYLIAGELSLSGETRPIRGALALALLAKSFNKKGVILPTASAYEATLIDSIPIFAVNSLKECVDFLSQKSTLSPYKNDRHPQKPIESTLDFAELQGQLAARRAVTIAVAGGHNLLLIGPPGSGKSMIAKCIPSILPSLTLQETIDITRIYSAAGKSLNNSKTFSSRPFRNPHHTISEIGLIGGGSNPSPGEISLAHHGVLFLDELPEFHRSTLDSLRQPLENGMISISRSAGKTNFPAAFMLVAAMNPCPCGHSNNTRRECRCTIPQILKYRSRISGPLLDRIDIQIEVPVISLKEMHRSPRSNESSTSLKAKIEQARSCQAQRFKGLSFQVNAQMDKPSLRQFCELSEEQQNLFQEACESIALSSRAHDRILCVARTIADLEQSETIATDHLLEAISYRTLDRQLF